MIEHDGLYGYYAEATGSELAVLILPDVNGLTDGNKSFCDDLAAEGITALAWDPWHGPTGDDTSRDELMKMIGELDDENVVDEQRRWLDYLQGLGISRFATMGFCLGGRLVFLLAAADDRISSVVAYHPSISVPALPNQTVDAFDAASRTDAAVLVHYPQQDSMFPITMIDDLTSALRRRDGAISVVGVYGTAEHGFSSPLRRDTEANRLAFAVSWPQTISFLHTTTR